MSGFTKGPWRTDPEAEHQCVIGSDGYLVADCAIFGFGDIADARSNSVCEANAHLIAAAPDMYEALEKLLHAVCGETGFAAYVRADSGRAYPWPALDEAEALSRAALASLQTGGGGRG